MEDTVYTAELRAHRIEIMFPGNIALYKFTHSLPVQMPGQIDVQRSNPQIRLVFVLPDDTTLVSQ